ncbi:MAG: signal recognition particle-docking protein FtsY [Legionella sp.]|nr:signal recognition particle-docking protein FtsY [Legionella sp.]
MIKWFKRKSSPSSSSEENDLALQESHANLPIQTSDSPTENPASENADAHKKDELNQQNPLDELPAPVKTTFFTRFKQGLEKTRQQLGQGIRRLLSEESKIDEALLEELETLLIRADVGINTAQTILDQLRLVTAKQPLADGTAIYQALQEQLREMLQKVEVPSQLESSSLPSTRPQPLVILVVGVNGAGKTTSIGKLAKHFQQDGKKVLLAAGDTFRAAAIEQLQIWGERNAIPVIAQHSGADSASVIFDALQAAKARGIDVLIADTAGRLHTQSHLMDELKKVKRVLKKLDADAPHETLLVLDATTGQNALNQARQFHEAVGLTGLVMTKLDGTAKGGILFTIANELKIPIRYLGMGEKIDDLRPFNAEQFVKALFNE